MKDTKYLWTQVAKICLFLAVFLFIQTIISYFYIRQISITQLERELKRLTTTIKQDLVYSNGRWDLSLYTSDPNTPHPQGSSGFPNPLYIVTTSGFVIERNQPINGLLDSSDFDTVQTYQQPTTLNTITNENWRIASKPVQSNGKVLGDIVVAYYNSENRPTAEIDQKIQANLDIILGKVRVKGNTIEISQVDIRNVHYDVSFEIVDSFNKVLLNNGRMPTFLDRSYVAKELEAQQQNRIVTDTKTGEKFYIVTEHVLDANGNPIALISAGHSIEEIQKTLSAYVIFAAVSGALILLPLSWIVLEFIQKMVKQNLHKQEKSRERAPILNKIIFNKKESILMLNETKIQIPYASNQYYILSALFGNPKKRWEQDEILEKFGEVGGEEGWRKVYDSHLAINKKVGFKLIDYRDKLFRINPEFLPAIIPA